VSEEFWFPPLYFLDFSTAQEVVHVVRAYLAEKPTTRRGSSP
jgi:hypothetical protein